MSTQMPILQEVIRKNPTIFNAHTQKPLRTKMPVREFLSRATIFDVQVTSDIYWRSQKDYFALDSIGPLRMPYPSMWMEWEVPDGAVIQGSTVGPKGEEMSWIIGMRCGALLLQNDELNAMDIMTFVLRPTGEIVTWKVTRRIIHDLQSYPEGQMVYDPDEMNIEDAKKIEPLQSMLNMPAVMAIGMINCKNIETQENGRIGLARTAAEKRRKIPARKIKYHTIVLPGGGSKSDGKGGHRATAIHQVRGHFKTFTAEKPLLGQHVGTYWWGWQVRGKAENGIVVSDYKVGVK